MMPINILFYLLCLTVGILLVANLAYPLINPRYGFFGMFRKKGFVKASEDLEEARVMRETHVIQGEVRKINSSIMRKTHVMQGEVRRGASSSTENT